MTDSAEGATPDDATPSTWTADWGRLLRTARQVAGLSLSALSLTTGLSKGHLSKLESGHPSAANPSRATLAALARALPSFRPLANTLEPGGSVTALVFGAETSPLQAVPSTGHEAPLDDAGLRDVPLRLGWRELEIVMAVLAFDAAAAPVPISALLLARATGRSTADVRGTLDGLVATHVLTAAAPTVPGASPTFRRSREFEARTGIVRLGDALVLAAGLLAQATAGHSPPRRLGRVATFPPPVEEA
jgi:transcriptional regulator with XRE-family HTH domain